MWPPAVTWAITKPHVSAHCWTNFETDMIYSKRIYKSSSLLNTHGYYWLFFCMEYDNYHTAPSLVFNKMAQVKPTLATAAQCHSVGTIHHGWELALGYLISLNLWTVHTSNTTVFPQITFVCARFRFCRSSGLSFSFKENVCCSLRKQL